MDNGSGVLLSQAAAAATLNEYGVREVSPATAVWFRYGMRRLAAFLGGDVPAEGVSRKDVLAWRQYELDEGVSPVTVNSYLRAVKTVYSRLSRRGELEGNPAAGIPFSPEPPPRPKAISEADYLAMREAAVEPRDRAMIDVLWSSGCRIGGLLSMRVDRLEHWMEGERHCFAAMVLEKGQKTRWIYVGAEQMTGEGLHEYLLARPRSDCPQLFLTMTPPWGALSAGAAQHVLKRLKAAAGIPRERPTNAHSFRHAFAIRHLNEGVDLPAVSAWLGHYSPEFTAQVYVIRSERELRAKYFRGGDR